MPRQAAETLRADIRTSAQRVRFTAANSPHGTSRVKELRQAKNRVMRMRLLGVSLFEIERDRPATDKPSAADTPQFLLTATRPTEARRPLSDLQAQADELYPAARSEDLSAQPANAPQGPANDPCPPQRLGGLGRSLRHPGPTSPRGRAEVAQARNSVLARLPRPD